MKQFLCDACGLIPHVEFDGYEFGDKTLEGVKFKAAVKDSNKLTVDTVKDWYTNRHLRGLNRTMWMKAALAFALENDPAQCPKCGMDIEAQPQEAE